MTTPDSMAARAALDAARVVFAPMLGGSADGSTRNAATMSASRAEAAWNAAARVLAALTGRDDLRGQALVGEARRLELLALEDAYPLVALHAWKERMRDRLPDEPGNAAPSSQEQQVAEDALRSLERIVRAVEATSNPYSRPAGSAPSGSAPPSAAPFEPPPPPSEARDVRMLEEIAAPSSHRRVFRSAGFVLSALALLLLGGAGAWYWFTQRSPVGDFEDGLAAYQRGSREVARIAFAKAARATPDDPRPLVFLGRLAREEGNLPSARRFLDAAIRIAPSSAVANRELAAVLLADGNPEVARRFYIRAVQLDPTDRLAQGFLGCALHRLGRTEEAQRWSDRAGPGDWTPCLNAPPPPLPPASAAPPTRAR